MDALIYSLNATAPVFLVILFGYIIKRLGMVDDGFIDGANKLNYKITLPSLLLLDMMNMDIKAIFEVRYVLYCALVTTISFWGLWAIVKFVLKDKSMVGAFVQGSFRSSAAVLGTALIVNIYGDAGFAPLMLIGCVPLYNIYSVIVLTFESRSKQDKNIKKAFVEILKNPILIGIFSGMLFSVLDVDFPHIIDSTINNFAKMATPLALIAIGAGFNAGEAIKKVKPAVMASLCKLVFIPIIFLPFAVACGFTGGKLMAILIMLGAPTTPSCYIMAKNMDNDEVLTSGIVVLTTIMSAFTITIFMFILRYNGLV